MCVIWIVLVVCRVLPVLCVSVMLGSINSFLTLMGGSGLTTGFRGHTFDDLHLQQLHGTLGSSGSEGGTWEPFRNLFALGGEAAVSGTVFGSFFILCAFSCAFSSGPAFSSASSSWNSSHSQSSQPSHSSHCSAARSSPPSSHLRQPWWDHWFGASTSFPASSLESSNSWRTSSICRFRSIFALRLDSFYILPLLFSLAFLFVFLLLWLWVWGLGSLHATTGSRFCGGAFAAGFFMGLASPSLVRLAQSRRHGGSGRLLVDTCFWGCVLLPILLFQLLLPL